MDEEQDRTEIESFLRQNLSKLEVSENAILISGIIISEWISPSGRRFLARTPIGDPSSWQTQGYLFSTLFAGEWEEVDDDNSLNEDEDEDYE